MIILDTNVLSELMKAAPAAGVVGWVASQPASRLFTTAVTQEEILYGIGLLPKGKRHNRIAIAAKAMFAEDFNDRILAFNPRPQLVKLACDRYGKLDVLASNAGVGPISPLMVAAFRRAPNRVDR